MPVDVKWAHEAQRYAHIDFFYWDFKVVIGMTVLSLIPVSCYCCLQALFAFLELGDRLQKRRKMVLKRHTFLAETSKRQKHIEPHFFFAKRHVFFQTAKNSEVLGNYTFSVHQGVIIGMFVCFFGSEGVVGQRCGDPCVGRISVCMLLGQAWVSLGMPSIALGYLMAGHWRWACNMRRLTPLLPHWVGWWNLTPVSLLTCRQPPACRWPLGRKPVTLFTSKACLWSRNYIDVDSWTMFSHYSRVSAWCHHVPSSYLMAHDLIYAFFAAIVWTCLDHLSKPCSRPQSAGMARRPPVQSEVSQRLVTQ